MKIIKILVITIVIGLIAALGFVYSGLYNVGASSPHSGLADWVLSTTSHASIKRRAKNIDVPDLEDEALQIAGINDFQSMCAGCHGAPGQDPEALGQGLNPPAPDLAESAADMTPAELFWVTRHGIKMTGMPAWGATHDDGDLWPVVAFIATLPGLDADAYQSMLSRAEGVGHHGEADPGAHAHDETTGSDDSKPQEKKHGHDDQDRTH